MVELVFAGEYCSTPSKWRSAYWHYSSGSCERLFGLQARHLTFDLRRKKTGLDRHVRQIVNATHLSVAVSGTVVLAVIVNLIELLCAAGLPALYTQILTIQDLPAWQNYR
ncbi:MAG: hypothetical protein KF752_19605 [Pirellulaceae bacterium]|nr:hypothetical protein [Pirellulaceae bacterium]